MKKWISVICLVVLILTMAPTSTISANASTYEENSGICGENLTWEISGSILKISGLGPMYDYAEDRRAPWGYYAQKIMYVELEDGVTSIGDYAFVNINRFYETIVPETVTSIGKKAFMNAKGDLWFFGDAPSIAEDAFTGAIMGIMTVFDWDEKGQNFGGSISWTKADIRFDSLSSKQLLFLNEEFESQDMVFHLYRSGQKYDDYVPKQVTFSAYDNMTCGEKSLTVNADGYTFEHAYFVTDGTYHLESIQVEFPEFPEYKVQKQELLPTVTMGSMVLSRDWQYTAYFDNKIAVGTDGQIRIKGYGITEGFEKTFYYPVLKTDVANARATLGGYEFSGTPITPTISINANYWQMHLGTDYEILVENNVNVGTGTVRIIGINNYYGELIKTFPIRAQDKEIMLPGNYLGTVDGELSEDVAYNQMILPPCKTTAYIGYTGIHVVGYQLYRVEDEAITLIDEVVSDVGYRNDTEYTYDFSSVYEDAKDEGGHVYMLSYSWVNENSEVYGGVYVLIVPAKVADATSMTMKHIENDGDFRKEYLSVSGDDGALGEVKWTSSDSSVATVEKGTVTLHKPGIVTISAQYGEMIETKAINVPALDFTQGIIFDYSEETGTVRVIYDNRLLTEGTDYVLSVEKNGDAATVTATGCGLFTGELVKVFENLDSLADPHTHGFTNSCDSTCNSCEFTRDNDHSFSGVWSKDQMHHWRACTACGEKRDHEEHSISPENDQECAICGTLWIPGDIDGNMMVNRDDVVQLLLHVSMPAAFPIVAPADFTGDGTVTRDDVVQLLLHVSMPESFPLA